MVQPGQVAERSLGMSGRPVRRMAAADRQHRIALLVAQSGYVAISELAGHLGVSHMTVRRDLDALAAAGSLERAPGGAVAARGAFGARIDIVEPGIDERMRRNSHAKAKIGEAAAGIVEDGQTIAVDIGSTALCLAHALKSRDVRIFTNSLKIGASLARCRPSVYVPGGEVRGSEPSVVGAMARSLLESLRFDWFFLGASGLCADGLFDYSLEDTDIKRTLMAQSSRTVALVDGAKFGRRSIVRIDDLNGIDMLVTDARPDGPMAEALASAGVDLRLVD